MLEDAVVQLDGLVPILSSYFSKRPSVCIYGNMVGTQVKQHGIV